MYYRIISELTMDLSLKDKFKKIFPNHEVKEKGNVFIVKDDSSKTIVDFCEGLAKKEGKEITVKDSDEIMVIVESFGQLGTEDIFKKSLEVLKKELDLVSKELK